MDNESASPGGTPGTCFICRKHEGLEPAPPGGYIFQDEYWMVCHAPGKLGPLGTLFIEARRHFLDYAAMTNAEAAGLGGCLRKAYVALREQTDSERIYQLSTNEGVPHFHAWLVPRARAVSERGIKYLGLDLSCTDEAAAELAARLRAAMNA